MLGHLKDIQFQLVAGHVCLDFANSLDNRGSSNEIELIPTYDHLLRFCEQCGALSKEEIRGLQKVGEREPTAAAIARNNAVNLRETICEIFSAVANEKPPSPAAVEQLNRFASEAGANRIVVPEQHGFAWKWAEIDANPRGVLWPFAWKAAELLASEERALVRECASPTCSWLFLDKSKSHSRRWCDMKVCGNRSKARNFYRRARTAAR
jgi:predicted RNA-binding Zn ribbon-like protein